MSASPSERDDARQVILSAMNLVDADADEVDVMRASLFVKNQLRPASLAMRVLTSITVRGTLVSVTPTCAGTRFLVKFHPRVSPERTCEVVTDRIDGPRGDEIRKMVSTLRPGMPIRVFQSREPVSDELPASVAPLVTEDEQG